MMILSGGTIVDGTGRAPFIGDVIVEGERIVDVVEKVEKVERVEDVESADVILNLTQPSQPSQPYSTFNLQPTTLITPGFIDAHSHSDAYLVIEPDAPSKVSQGITTEINGQCGGSVAPRYGEARLSSDWAAILGEKLSWRSMAEYRAVLESVRPAINSVQFIGHNTLRSSVVGYAGRNATPDELARMQALLEESLDEGAYGLTTGLIYQPGKYADGNEVLTLARAAARKGGFYATHMRSEGDQILEAIDEVIELVRATGIRAEISHLKTSGKRNWHKIDAVIEKIAGAVERGDLIGSDRYPFTAAGTDLDIVLPDWAQEGAAPSETARLADPSLRARIIREINASDRDWSTVMIGGVWSKENAPYSGKTVAEILEPDETPGEKICNILERDGCKTGAFFFGMSEDNLNRILQQDWIVPGSDASLRAPWGPLGKDFPHPRAYSTMPEFYRRLRKLGYSLEQTVRRMTAIPAQRFGLRQRGIIAKGNYADIAVWNPNEFCGKATFANPHQFCEGVKLTMTNGHIAYMDGKFTGDRGGRLLAR